MCVCHKGDTANQYNQYITFIKTEKNLCETGRYSWNRNSENLSLEKQPILLLIIEEQLLHLNIIILYIFQFHKGYTCTANQYMTFIKTLTKNSHETNIPENSNNGKLQINKELAYKS